MPHLRRRFSRMTLASASTAARRLSVPKLATLWHHLQPTPGCHQIKRLVVANGCQYMSIHVNTHQVSPCELCDSAPTRRGDHRWRWSLVPNAQSRIQHDPTRLPTVRPASTTLSKSGSGIFDTRRRCNMGSASSSSCTGRLPGGRFTWLESMIRIHQ